MIKPTPKTGFVTHKGCLDGTGSAYMFVRAGGLPENVLFRTPSKCDLTPEEAANFDEVWFADLCPSAMTESVAGGRPFRVFDHHVSNMRKFNDDPHCTFAMDRSGTSLMAELTGYVDSAVYTRAARERLVRALEAYDLGRFDDSDGMMLADLASAFSQTQMLNLLLHYGADDVFHSSNLTARAEALASARKLHGEEAASRARFTGVQSAEGYHRWGVAVSPVYWKNEVAQRILASGKVDVAMIIDITGNMISLRSLPGGPDCSRIAAPFGGGGHARAAGFTIKRDVMLDALIMEVLG